MPLDQEQTKVKQKKTKVKQKKTKVKVKEAKTSRFADLVARITLASIVLVFMVGCSNYKVTLPNNTEILFQRVFGKVSADKVDFYYEDADYIVWMVANDPDSSINPGGLKIKEPNTGIEASIEAK